ncbi:MAG: alanine racemase [Elusimicrobia bacterium]|nr:alanine racemase [Elusimicrobiota bacterium]
MLKWIEIDLSAIASNLETIRKQLEPGVQIMAVIKADAYGHGAIPVAHLCLQKKVEVLGVLTLEEALTLRTARIKTPIALLCPPPLQEVKEVLRHRLIPTVDSTQFLEALTHHLPNSAPYPITVDLDFGLGRWGILPQKLNSFLQHIKKLKKIKLSGLSTHLDYIPGKNAIEAEEKLSTFSDICGQVKRHWPQVICHAANSSILLDFPQHQMGMVRIGNLLYGINPTSRRIPLKNPWQFYAKIISIKKIPKGRPIGYGSEYIPTRPMTIGTLPAGYADGLTMEPAERLIRLRAGFKYWGTLKGRQIPFIGRCGISHVLIDLSQVPSAKIGDAVSLPIRRTAANTKIPRIYKTRPV